MKKIVFIISSFIICQFSIHVIKPESNTDSLYQIALKAPHQSGIDRFDINEYFENVTDDN